MPQKFSWPWRLLTAAVVVVALAAALLTVRAPRNQPQPRPGRSAELSPAVGISTADERIKKTEAQAKNAEDLRKREAEQAWPPEKPPESPSREQEAKIKTREQAEWDARVKSAKPLRDGHTWGNDAGRAPIGCHLTMPEGFEHSEVRFRMGDDERWSEPGLDDREWRDLTHAGLPQRAGIFWIRYHVRPMDERAFELAKKPNGKFYLKNRLPGGIYQKVCAAFDLFWDGKLVARSGVPGNSWDQETPGKLDTVFSLPDEWQGPGEHVVAMRMSTHYGGFSGEHTELAAGFAAPQELLAQFNRSAFQPTLTSGAMFMVAAMGFVLWLLADRRLALLLFVGLCLCGALTQWLAVWRYFFTYTYDWHYTVRLASVYLAAGFGACLLMFVVGIFAVPHGRWLFAVFLALVVAIRWSPEDPYLNQKGSWVMLAAFLGTLACATWATWRRKRGAGLALAGLAISVLVHLRGASDFIEGGFFPTILPAMLGLLSAVSLQVRDQREQAERAQLTAARLEVELLKKNLQPHFLMNTLTALTEVIEQNPGAAATLIDDLATEFRTLSRLSGEKQVSLAEEIELCRVHLRVMSVRTGVAWSLVADEVDANEPVPPAMFLTLIENAFVHQRVAGKEAAFRLRMEARGGEVRYVFVSPGELQPTKTVRVSGGTGLRYVKARLEESFPGRWAFEHRAVAEGWETTITVRALAENPR